VRGGGHRGSRPRRTVQWVRVASGGAKRGRAVGPNADARWEEWCTDCERLRSVL
jgi:hypothetical protein